MKCRDLFPVTLLTYRDNIKPMGFFISVVMVILLGILITFFTRQKRWFSQCAPAYLLLNRHSRQNTFRKFQAIFLNVNTRSFFTFFCVIVSLPYRTSLCRLPIPIFCLLSILTVSVFSATLNTVRSISCFCSCVFVEFRYQLEYLAFSALLRYDFSSHIQLLNSCLWSGPVSGYIPVTGSHYSTDKEFHVNK